MPQLVKNNFFGQYLPGECFEKPLLSLYLCFSSTSIIKIHSIVGFIKTRDEQTLFYFWRYSEVACHKLSHFNSHIFILWFTWNCCSLQEAKKFSRNPGQFKCDTRETRYHASIAELLIRNPWSQIEELVRRSRTMLKISYFNGWQQFFQISPRIKSFYDRNRKPIHLFAGEAQFGTKEAISANLLTMEATWAHLTGAFGQGAFLFLRQHPTKPPLHIS